MEIIYLWMETNACSLAQDLNMNLITYRRLIEHKLELFIPEGVTSFPHHLTNFKFYEVIDFIRLGVTDPKVYLQLSDFIEIQNKKQVRKKPMKFITQIGWLGTCGTFLIMWRSHTQIYSTDAQDFRPCCRLSHIPKG